MTCIDIYSICGRPAGTVHYMLEANRTEDVHEDNPDRTSDSWLDDHIVRGKLLHTNNFPRSMPDY